MNLEDNYKDIESFDARHLLIIRAFCDKANISSIIDSALDTRMECSPGKIVTGLILGTLAGRNLSLQSTVISLAIRTQNLWWEKA